MRYFAPKGTAGLATLVVKTPKRVPCPPARSIAMQSFLLLPIIFPPYILVSRT
jgi:hypothetical protein